MPDRFISTIFYRTGFRISILLSIAVWLGLAATPVGAIQVTGTVSEFTSANDVAEQCIELTGFPGAIYSINDRKMEAEYCAIDFGQSALCPKLWSTSPGTIVYQIDAAQYQGDYRQFEQQHCAAGHHAKDAAVAKLATFKISVNHSDTSATYAPSSWIYYHLSRYFETGVQVPVAVFRTMDKQFHLDRVTLPALKIIAGRRGLKMLKAGWNFLESVESAQQSASESAALLTQDKTKVFGVLLDNKGDRYREDFNGTRESGWGKGQNYDFQQTAAFLALRSTKPLPDAVTEGIHQARANPAMARKVPADLPPAQVALWMKDLLEITLLDYMLGQQDRIGNIDYQWRWYWVKDGVLKSKKAQGKQPPEDLKTFQPKRLRRTAINDNDAGVRRGYSNFTKLTGMLDGLAHYHAPLYRKLARLNSDLQSKGKMHQWFVDVSGLSDREIEAIRKRTFEAFSILQKQCEAGTMKLDLDPIRFFAQANKLQDSKDQSCDSEPGQSD